MISRCVWNSKMPRIKQALQLPKERGAAKWKDSEETQFDLPAQSIMGNYQQQGCNLDEPNQPNKVALKVWFRTSKRFHLEKHARALKWVAYDAEVKTSCLDI